MAKLPFVVEPRLQPIIELIGSDESGKIQIERRGYLSAGEKAFMGASMAGDDTASAVVGVVRRIAKQFKMDMQECYKLVTDLLTTGAEGEIAEAITEQFGDDLELITRAMLAAEQRRGFVQAYCMLLYRVDANIKVEEAMELHGDIIQGLTALYVDEENRSTERLIEDTGTDGTEEAAVEDIEKK
jgi:hypothetical protein